MRRTKEYIAVKNFIHNELGFSKEEFRKVLLETIEDEARTFVRRELQINSPEKIIEGEFKRNIRDLLNGSSYNSNSRELMQTIGKEVFKLIEIKIK